MSGSPIPEVRQTTLVPDSIRPSDNDMLAYRESTTNMYLLLLLPTDGSNHSLGYGEINGSYPQKGGINSFYFYKVSMLHLNRPTV
ncbi:hypothetical protein JTB14_026238 [Gonioctena quinquepunctata]|nr:hypothetical protein JTB14_026238 [Gonioctena quinquepunctata]